MTTAAERTSVSEQHPRLAYENAWANFAPTFQGVQTLLLAAHEYSQTTGGELPPVYFPELLPKGHILSQASHRPAINKWFTLVGELHEAHKTQAEAELEKLTPKKRNQDLERERERQRQSSRQNIDNSKYGSEICQQARAIVTKLETEFLATEARVCVQQWDKNKGREKAKNARLQLEDMIWRMREFNLFPNMDSYYPCIEVATKETQRVVLTAGGRLMVMPGTDVSKAKPANDSQLKEYGKQAFEALAKLLSPAK